MRSRRPQNTKKTSVEEKTWSIMQIVIATFVEMEEN